MRAFFTNLIAVEFLTPKSPLLPDSLIFIAIPPTPLARVSALLTLALFQFNPQKGSFVNKSLAYS